MEIEVPTRLGAGALIYYQGVSEPETKALLSSVLKSADTVFDIGAHIGEYSIIAARIVGNAGRVHAFEPNPNLYKVLQRNLELNAIDNCIPNSVALADRHGELLLDAAGDPSEGHIRNDDSNASAGKSFRVKVVTLDDYWSAIGRPKVNFIKMDIEGAELLALKGAVQLLSAHEEIVLLGEALEHTTRRFGYDFQELNNFLRSLGFQLFDLQHLLMRQITALSAYPASGNFVAVRNVESLESSVKPSNGNGESSGYKRRGT